MCRNHSHITAQLTGLLTVGPTQLHEVRVIHPLEVQLPYGERWIKPSGSTLYVPVSMCVPLPATQPQAMEVCYIPSYYMGDLDGTTMPERQTKPMSAGDYGLARYADGELSSQRERIYDDDLPFG